MSVGLAVYLAACFALPAVFVVGWILDRLEGVPLALSYAGILRETECRFALDDAETAEQALAIVRRFSRSDAAEIV